MLLIIKKKKQTRINLYKQKKWNNLLCELEYEQSKRNNKNNRRTQKLIEAIETGTNKQYNNTENKEENQNKEQYIDLLQSKMMINHGNTVINTNLLVQEADNIKYQPNETTNMIKERVKRCIKKFKKRTF
jgi:hypothetical protein